jgi:hypothetical protein
MLIQQSSGTSLQRVIAGPIKIQSPRLQPTGGWSCAIRPEGGITTAIQTGHSLEKETCSIAAG